MHLPKIFYSLYFTHAGRDASEVDSNGSGSKVKEQSARESNEVVTDGFCEIPLVKHAVAFFGSPKGAGITYFDKKNPRITCCFHGYSIGPATDHTDGAMKQEVILFTA